MNERVTRRGERERERVVAAVPPNPIRSAFAATSDDVCVGES